MFQPDPLFQPDLLLWQALTTKMLTSNHAVYPLPDNSDNALQLIFPNATDELSQRHGLRLLEKAFKRSDTYCLVAQCKIQYMEEGF